MNPNRPTLTNHQKILALLIMAMIYPYVMHIKQVVESFSVSTQDGGALFAAYLMIYTTMTLMIVAITCPSRHISTAPWCVIGVALSYWPPMIIAMVVNGIYFGTILHGILSIVGYVAARIIRYKIYERRRSQEFDTEDDLI